MIRSLLLAGMITGTSFTLSAQIAFGGRPITLDGARELQAPPIITLPTVDVEALLAEDAAREAQGIKGPWRFGFNHAVDLGLENSGVWDVLPNGDRLWRLSIESTGAFSINFEFNEYIIPEGARVFVINEDGEFLGSFTQESSGGQHSMGVTQITGDRITIEYHEPATVAGQGSLRIGQVTHAYRDIMGKSRGLGDSGSCNNNVICPLGDNWRDQIRSVAMITVSGNGLCTGQLINNCENDGTPYFLTANHCVFGSVSNWVFRFNWESAVCDENLNGPTNQTVSGSSLKVQSASTDVALLELNTTPPESYDVFYTGWNRSTDPSPNVTAIHHPSGDIKKISHEAQAVTASNNFGGNTGTLNYWHVHGWDDGTTEGGSSGSGLWDSNGLLVGQLWGGSASCSFNFDDFYGRFDKSYPVLEEWLGDCGEQLQGHPLLAAAIAEAAGDDHSSIVPNPTSGQIMVVLPRQVGELTTRIFDATGRMVVQNTHGTTGRLDLDLSILVEGIYFLELKGLEFHAVERVVISR